MLNRSDILILDTETTGISHRSEVIEVAVIDTTGKVLFESLSMPQRKVPRVASAVHGLTSEDLEKAQAPRWPEVYADLLPILRSATTILAWNAKFDQKMLRQTTRRHALKWPQLPWQCAMHNYSEQFGIGKEGRCSLAAAASLEGVKLEGAAHRALHDCRLVLGVMRATAQQNRHLMR